MRAPVGVGRSAQERVRCNARRVFEHIGRPARYGEHGGEEAQEQRSSHMCAIAQRKAQGLAEENTAVPNQNRVPAGNVPVNSLPRRDRTQPGEVGRGIVS